jgi:hypothetical protein
MSGNTITTGPLAGMTQQRWDAMTPAQRDQLRDTSALNPQMVGLEGKRVRVTPKQMLRPSTFRVGISTGWRPVHLAMRNSRQLGSSDIIGKDERFETVTALD